MRCEISKELSELSYAAAAYSMLFYEGIVKDEKRNYFMQQFQL